MLSSISGTVFTAFQLKDWYPFLPDCGEAQRRVMCLTSQLVLIFLVHVLRSQVFYFCKFFFFNINSKTQ